MKLRAYFAMLETRTLNLVGVGVLLLLVALIISYVVVPKTKEYQAVAKAKAVLEGNAVHQPNLDDEINLQKQSVEQLRKSIHGEIMNIPEQYIESFVIGMLQKMAWANNVEIGSIQPVPWRIMKSYRELVFNVEFSGDYFDLHQLINAMATEMGFIVIKKMEVTSQQADPKLLVMKMTIASYRTQE